MTESQAQGRRLLGAPRTDPPPGFLSLLRCPRCPRTPLRAEWEESRRANEAAYWAGHLDEFVTRLPRMRHNRGETRAARLVRDVIAAIGKARGPDEAVFARERIADRWRRGEEP